MRASIFVVFGLLGVLLLNSVAPAFETDQYNLPPVLLADIGDEVSQYVEQKIVMVTQRLNSEIAQRKLCIERALERPKGCSTAAQEQKKLEYLRSDEAFAEELADLLAGDTLTTTKFGDWIYPHKFAGQPDRYKADWTESIYLINPPDYLTLSPTVRLYGVDLGIDKLEHLFQQGHQYYEIERKALAKGSTPAEAVKKSISWGKLTERTYYGLMTSGVYSNADLFANYAGLQFYHGLTKPLRLGETTRPPVAILDDGLWKMNPRYRRDDLLKPFISNHMNEALNPSAFRLTLVRSVRRAVRDHACEDWLRAEPNLSADSITNRTRALEFWNGEDYGHTKKSRVVTLADSCFGD